MGIDMCDWCACERYTGFCDLTEQIVRETMCGCVGVAGRREGKNLFVEGDMPCWEV
jgi:hypothetical protein